MTIDVNLMFTDNFSDGRVQYDTLNDPFDRYAVVSFGPNQVLDDTQDADNDDIFYLFGMVFDATSWYAYYK
jgi:hypothetical protein